MNARVTPSLDPATAPSPLLVDVAIIGAGFGGLCMAIQLLKNGNDRFVVLEYVEATPGPRIVQAIDRLAKAFHPRNM